MEGYDANTFGDLNAENYDTMHDPGTTDHAVALLHDLFGASDVLELAIGSGRIALPLVAKGVKVSGIEASQKMVDLMRAKPGGADIPVVIGDIADVEIAGPFDHAYLVFNTLFNLPSQDAQIRCFTNTAKVLKPGGTFVIETFVPVISDFTNHQRLQTKRLDMQTVWLEAALHDPVRQVFDFQRIRITDQGMTLVPLPMRYAYPPELDLMARLAGLTLAQRWGGWDKSAFDKDSKMHITVYQKPAA